MIDVVSSDTHVSKVLAEDFGRGGIPNEIDAAGPGMGARGARSRVLRSRWVVSFMIVLGAIFAIGTATLVADADQAGASVTGIDVASYQHGGDAPIDWNAVKAAGHSFGYIKATERRSTSGGYVNPWFQRDWDAAGRAGLYRGAYHFAIPSYPIVPDALDEARYFVSTTGSMAGPLDLPAMLDLEYNPYGVSNDCYGLSQSDFVVWARTWLDEVKRLTGKPPVVYTGGSYWNTCSGNSTAIGSEYRLWIASYPNDPNSTTFRPTVPAGWPTWTFWQYRSDGAVPGIVGNVDMNRFCCDLATLAGLAGSGAGAGLPFGNLDGVTRTQGEAHVSGWAIDPDLTGPIDVHVYVDGVIAAIGTANGARPDVGAVFPGWGANHGYDIPVRVGPGEHRICAYAINRGAGLNNPSLGCSRSLGQPFGNLESAGGGPDGTIDLRGWAIDPDSTNPIDVHFYVDGNFAGLTSTGLVREDVAAVFPASGPAGFSTRIAGISGGSHTVCAFAIDPQRVLNPRIGCNVTFVGGGAPVGSLDGVSPGFAVARVVGWSIDPDTTGSVEVYASVDGTLTTHAPANTSRPDVAAVFPVMGANHGYSFDVPVPSGTHRVCTYGFNVGIGSHTLLGCRSVTNSAKPTGNLEWSARAYGYLGVSGWAIDPDSTSPVQIRITVNGVALPAIVANGSRPDVGAAFPGFGSLHGFTYTWTAPPAPARVCVTIVNVGAGTVDTDLGCRTL